MGERALPPIWQHCPIECADQTNPVYRRDCATGSRLLSSTPPVADISIKAPTGLAPVEPKIPYDARETPFAPTKANRHAPNEHSPHFPLISRCLEGRASALPERPLGLARQSRSSALQRKEGRPAPKHATPPKHPISLLFVAPERARLA
jgi:hypothetical protein